MRTARVAAGLTLLVGLAGASLASELSQVINKGNHIIALNRLGVTVEQINRLAPLSEDLVAAVKQRQAGRATLLEDGQEVLAEARRKLLAGEPLSADLVASLAEFEEGLSDNDAELYEASVDILKDVQEVLYAQQNAYIDWTPPRGENRTSRETMIQQAQRERDHRAMVMMGERFLHSIRYYPLEQYILEAQRLVDDFLRPIIPPNSPDYRPAQQYMFKLVEQVRLMEEPQWIDQGQAVAEQMIGDLGLQQPQTEAVRDQPYNWQDMYDIFSDLAAPEMLRSMKLLRRM